MVLTGIVHPPSWYLCPKPLDQAVVFASAAGALSVTRLGAQLSVPTREETEVFLEAAL